MITKFDDFACPQSGDDAEKNLSSITLLRMFENQHHRVKKTNMYVDKNNYCRKIKFTI